VKLCVNAKVLIKQKGCEDLWQMIALKAGLIAWQTSVLIVGAVCMCNLL